MFALTGRALQLLSYEVRGLHTAVYVIALSSLLFALVMGLLGGFLPSVRAARLNIVNALRSS